MALLKRLSHGTLAHRILVAAAIAVISANIALLFPYVGLAPFISRINELFYDGFYKMRSVEDQRNGQVVIVAVDDLSLASFAKNKQIGWPWPRDIYAAVIAYAQRAGAKAVVFDLKFEEPSVYRDKFDDDATLADAADSAKIPVLFANQAIAGMSPRFAIPLAKPRLGAVNIPETSDSVLRSYEPKYFGQPSLAAATLQALNQPQLVPDAPFLLHYYGPFEQANGQHTFTYVSCFNVVAASMGSAPAAAAAPPEMFRDKIVLVGAIEAGEFDQKASPRSGIEPGVEYQATAILNMLQSQQVHQLSGIATAAATLLIALLAAFAAAIPQRAGMKTFSCSTLILLGMVPPQRLFVSADIRSVPMASPVIAVALSLMASLLWSYFVEDRGRRFFVKALGQYVSPHVAAELAHNRERLKLGFESRVITVMFTDIAGFTSLSETLGPEALEKLLNLYLEEMSLCVFDEDGTIDKYIGDAIMAFWNAPLHQQDHAVRACRAALAIHRREQQVHPRLAELGGGKMYTRIGVNTGIMKVGNMGWSQKFNYSIIGDPVNIGSRLESANKMYGTRIMISQATADLVRDHFVLRPLDFLRVSGKLQPIEVYEILDQSPGEPGLHWLAETANAALEAYRAMDWAASEAKLVEILKKFPDDGPARTLMQRVAQFRHQPPPSDWDGVYVAEQK